MHSNRNNPNMKLKERVDQMISTYDSQGSKGNKMKYIKR